MRGHEEIIKARLGGVTPKVVFVNDYPCKTDWPTHGDYVTVCVHGDQIQSIDARFAVDLTVNISSLDDKRAKSLFERFKSAGARVVAACHAQALKHPLEQSGWADIWTQEGK